MADYNTNRAECETKAYRAIAKSLRDFGYPDCTDKMIRDTHTAMKQGDKLPHGIVGMMAESQLRELQEAGVIS